MTGNVLLDAASYWTTWKYLYSLLSRLHDLDSMAVVVVKPLRWYPGGAIQMPSHAFLAEEVPSIKVSFENHTSDAGILGISGRCRRYRGHQCTFRLFFSLGLACKFFAYFVEEKRRTPRGIVS